MVHYSKKINKTIILFIALSFLFNACDLSLVCAAQNNGGVMTQNLAKPSALKPITDEERATVIKKEAEVLGGAATLLDNKGKGIEELNSNLKKFDDGMRQARPQTGQAADTLDRGAVQFTQCTYNESKGEIAANFHFANNPDENFVVIYDGKKDPKYAKVAKEVAREAAMTAEAERPEVATQATSSSWAKRIVLPIILRSKTPQEQARTALLGPAIQQKEPQQQICDLSNAALDVVEKNTGSAQLYKEFFSQIIAQVQTLPQLPPEVARDVQLIASQALFIISQIEKGTPNALKMRLTANPQNMVQSPDAPRGPSFLDIRTIFFPTIPQIRPQAVQARAEGRPGIYWRGVERIAKLGNNVIPEAVYNQPVFETAKSAAVLYTMDHGFLPVPEPLVALTAPPAENGKISTIHETAFATNLLPGSIQYASTGIGHFQGMALDIKYVTEGRGIQYNKIYDAQGKLVKVFAQILEPGTWAVAIPGAVESIENLGGLRFNDFTVQVLPEIASIFNPDLFKPGFDFTKIAEIKSVIENSASVVPFTVVRVKGEDRLVMNEAVTPRLSVPGLQVTWVNPIPAANIFVEKTAIELYNNLNGIEDIKRIAEGVAQVTVSPNWPMPNQPENQPIKPIAPAELARYTRALKIAEAGRPIISIPEIRGSTLDNLVYKIYAWGGYIISRFLGMVKTKFAELWFNSTQQDGRSIIPGTDITLAEVIEANPGATLGPNMTVKPMFCKILGKDEMQPQIVHLGFNEKIKEVGKEQFVKWVIAERNLVIELKGRLAVLNLTEDQFKKEYLPAYEAWVSAQVRAKWENRELMPALPAFMSGFDRTIFNKIREIRANIVSVMNEIELKPGQVILSPVGYIHSIVGSHQMHPISGSEAKNEAWYIFSVKDEAGKEHLLYFEPQQTSNTTYSPFDFPTPIDWGKDKTTGTVGPKMRKDLPTVPGIEHLLNPGETAPTTDEATIRLMMDRAIDFEVAEPTDFIVNSRIEDITNRPSYANAIETRVESLIEGTNSVWTKDLFTVRRLMFNGQEGKQASITVNPVENSYHELIVLKGEVTVTTEDQTVVMKPGSSIFIPYNARKPYQITANDKAELVQVYPSRPEAERPEMTLEDIKRVVDEETAGLAKTVEATAKIANPADGVVILAVDDNIYSRFNFALALVQELGRRIARPDSIIIVKDKGEKLAGAVTGQVRELERKGIKVRKIVTQLNAQMPQAVRDDLASRGIVLNIDLKGKSLLNNYMQIIRLFDLSLKIAYSNRPAEDKDIIKTLSKIMNYELSAAEFARMIMGNVWNILPALGPVKESTLSEGYKAAKQAVSSL